MKTDVRVVKHSTFNSDGKVDEMYQIEIKDDVLNDITKENLICIKKAIELALEEGKQ